MKLNVETFYSGNKSCERVRLKLRKYCEETTLHGFKYLTQTSKYQSVFWYLICIKCFILCVLFIYFQMIRYRDNRVTTTVKTTNFPVWKVPFPAITICNSNLVYKSHTGEIIELLQKFNIPDNVIEEYFQNLSNTILNDEISRTTLNLEKSIRITRILEREGYNTNKLMDRLAQPCSSMLRKCEWRATEVDCHKLFKKTKTTGGFCCSYNYQGAKNTNPAEENQIFSGGFGSSYGLKVYLDVEESEYLSRRENSGFRVLVQNPYDYPDVFLYGSYVDVESKISISLRPLILSSAEELRNINVKSRGCLFSNEEIPWSKYYTVETCLKNCKLQVIWNMCECIPFYYPVSDKRFCTIMDSSCVIKAEKKFVNMRIDSDDEDRLRGIFVCNCPSLCNEITYTTTVQMEHMSFSDIAETDNDNLTVVSVHFGSSGIIEFRRNEFITWDTLLASIGGIIGLFLGGSIMSIIELGFHLVSWIWDCKVPSKSISKRNCKVPFKNIPSRNKINEFGTFYISELYPKGWYPPIILFGPHQHGLDTNIIARNFYYIQSSPNFCKVLIGMNFAISLTLID
nr:sodium channel protein Nach-like isoform X2 [Leptinotarsa decemlineata]